MEVQLKKEELDNWESRITAKKRKALEQHLPQAIRAEAVEQLIELTVSACTAHFDCLRQFRSSWEGDQTAQKIGRALKELVQRAGQQVEICFTETQKAQHMLYTAMETMQSNTMALATLIRGCEDEMISRGESADGAMWKSAVKVVLSDEKQIVSLRMARAESEEVAQRYQGILRRRKCKLEFSQQVLSLIQVVQAIRSRHDKVGPSGP
jgi:hypothetical protein